MNLIRQAVRRPVFTTMGMLIVLVVGLFSLIRIPLDLMPELTFPIISVRTTYENAAPIDVEEQITKPLERALAAVPGVEELSSTSAEGSSSIFIEFNWGVSLDEATNDIRDRIDRVISRLPDEVDRPAIQKFDTAMRPIMFLGVESSFHPVDLKAYIEDEISYRLERSPGVASASPFGGLDREFRVELDHSKVKALGVDLAGLVTGIVGENVTEAGGDLDRGRMSVAVRTRGEFATLDDLGSVLVARTEQGDVRLRDIADISDTWEKIVRITRVNSNEGQFMGVFKQSGANTVDVASTALNAIGEINRTLANVRIEPLFDSSVYIKQAIWTVAESAALGGLLAVLVIFFFLQHVKSTLVLSLSIPVSIVATFLAMYAFGLTLNIVTLGALALGTGMLVDNSIVVLDNIFRLRSGGMGAEEAAVEGTGEVGGAILASTLTTLSVFAPLAFLTGLAGVMFRPFALTICFALAASYLVAMTVVPMLARHMLTTPEGRVARAGRAVGLPVGGSGGGGPLTGGPADGAPAAPAVPRFGEPRWFRGFFKAVDEFYVSGLTWSLANPWKVIVIGFAVTALSLAVVTQVGREFMPRTDESAFRVYLTMEPGTRVERTSETLQAIEAIIVREVPEIRASSSDIGGSGGFSGRGSHKGEFQVRLVPVKNRKRSVFEIMDHVRPLVSNIPGTEVRLRAEQSFLARGAGGDRIEIELRGNDLEEAGRLTRAMRAIVENVPGVTDVYLSNEDAAPEELIVIDRDRAADAGLKVADVSALVKTAVGGTVAGAFRVEGKEYDIRVKLKDSERLSVEEIMSLPVVNSRGQKAVLANVARAVSGTGPAAVTRRNQARVFTLYADNTDRALGDVLRDIDAELKTLPMGRDFSYTFTGEAEDLEETFSGLKMVLIMSVFLVYMVMACQFEQLKGPFVVMFALPFAAIGVAWAHFLTGISFNINSFIGVIMLAGIVINNSIILVDHANLIRRRDGVPLVPALIETGRRRLRPIMMTTLTTVLGLIPMAWGIGEGGEAQIPLGRSVIGGLSTSTLITLFLVPCVYLLMFRGEEKRAVAKAAREAAAGGEGRALPGLGEPAPAGAGDRSEA
ncbi:MAG: efflux RND transporter permease subunit [Deltaproteobacteria bacterium]|jgi:HAE1 family hydrophobic/amphiphilic exporter-1|nr:efflux RND transporter permease subunit [Deltaproteobacteria bacterium]